MEYIGPRIIEKSVGTKYTVELDKHIHTVMIVFKGKPKNAFTFDKLYKAINFYAAIKLVKDIDNIYDLYDKHR